VAAFVGQATRLFLNMGPSMKNSRPDKKVPKRTILTRRALFGLVFVLAALSIAGAWVWDRASSPPAPLVLVYESPACGCCGKWVEYLHDQGLRTIIHQEADMKALKDRLGVPKAMRSCHTAQIGEYVIEGHVPAEDLKRLFAERPTVAGLAVPGMPRGTPGMAMPGAPTKPYDVIAFQKDGSAWVYARH
jgi:hypothetical protein